MSKLSILATWTIFGISLGSILVLDSSNFFSSCSKAILKGSLHVTRAKEPAKCFTMRSIPSLSFLWFGSKEKSLRASWRVVFKAMETERWTTGTTIFFIAESTEIVIISLRLIPNFRYFPRFFSSILINSFSFSL